MTSNIEIIRLLPYSQAVRQGTLTPSFRRFESCWGNQQSIVSIFSKTVSKAIENTASLSVSDKS